MAIAKKDIGQLLMSKGVLKPEDYRTALEVQKQTTQSLDRVLVDMGFVDENLVLEAKAQSLGVNFVNLRTARIDESAARRMPATFWNGTMPCPSGSRGTVWSWRWQIPRTSWPWMTCA